MTEFIQILNFWRSCFLQVFALKIPLSPSFGISVGSVVIGAIALPILIHILFRFFSDGPRFTKED